MKYKRLTERDEFGNADVIDVDTVALYSHLAFTDMNRVTEALNRFAELEDKIERGELISTVQAEQGEQEIAFFVAHNAEVRKQAVIEFAVRLKKKADSYNDEENYIDRSVMYTDIDDLVTEVCGE